MDRYCFVPTPWGPFTLVARGQALLSTSLPVASEEACAARVEREHPDTVYDENLMPALRAAVRAYFEGERTVFSIRLVLDGATPFQRAVIRACRRIPYGARCGYGELAARAGYEGAARAVGTVMARNRHPLVVPCHRVVSSGGIGGFSGPGGVTLKRAMLELEGQSAR
jgi:methylated-DNA-[protein]-cysteine S-methyltransferase